MPKNDTVFSRRAAIAGATSALVASGTRVAPARAATKVRFLTNWFAEAEHGGFYQAKATGLYEKAGLDVDIQMGGPQVNGVQLLGGGDADIIVSYDIQVLDSVEKGVPAGRGRDDRTSPCVHRQSSHRLRQSIQVHHRVHDTRADQHSM
jgi:uncharacterized protein with FMN-binding domain